MVSCKELIAFQKVKRIVVKVGTSIITTDTGKLDPAQLENLVKQIAQLVQDGYEILLVSSGAIAVGVESLGLSEVPSSIPELQAAASVGQGLLLQQYTDLFKEHQIKVGQVLLTQFDTTHRQQYLNACNTLKTLLELGVVPIINENDTTAVDEIRFGDNDTLAALVSNLSKADLLIILTDTDGLFTKDPRSDHPTQLLAEVEEITPEIEELAGGVGTRFGSGGMVTKIQAAKIVTFAQSAAVIANGNKANILKDVVKGERVGTFFNPKKKRLSSKKLWIAFGKASRGTIIVDEGAKEAVKHRGKSLLPAGVLNFRGNFEVGEAVDVCGEDETVFARGLTNFSSKELTKIKGLRRDQITSLISDGVSIEVIHRDDLVLL